MNFGIAPANEQERAEHKSAYRRSVVPPRVTVRNNLGERACFWLFPWSIRNYPGFRKGLTQLLGYSFAAIRSWRRTEPKYGLTSPGALRLADAIEARCNAGLGLVTELRAYAAKREIEKRGAVGFVVVRERDGPGSKPRDARHRGR